MVTARPEGTDDRRRTFLLLGAILGVAFLARVVVLLLTGAWDFQPDRNYWAFGFEVGQVADALSRGEGFSWPEGVFYPYVPGPTAWVAPLYPLFIAGVFSIAGSFTTHSALAIQFVQIAMSLLSCVLIYGVGARLFNPRTGLIAAALLAIYLPAIHFSVQKIGPVTLFTACVLAIFLLFLRMAEEPSVRRGIVLGCAIGLTALLDPVILGLCPFAAVWVYARNLTSRTEAMYSLAGMFAAIAVCVTPWLARNDRVFSDFVFIKSNFGHELLIGNHPGATGGPGDKASHKERYLGSNSDAVLSQYDEVVLNALHLELAMAYIAADPIGFVGRSAKRFRRFWLYPRPVRAYSVLVSQLFYWALLLLALGGAAVSWRKHDVRLLILFLLALPAPFYITHMSLYRYRFPTEILLLPLAASALCGLAQRWRLPVSSRVLSVSTRNDEQLARTPNQRMIP